MEVAHEIKCSDVFHLNKQLIFNNLKQQNTVDPIILAIISGVVALIVGFVIGKMIQLFCALFSF